MHGEAVATELVLALRLSVRLGLCAEADALRLVTHLRAVGLPTGLNQVGLGRAGGAIVDQMRNDKKNRSDGFALILAQGIGRAMIAPLPVNALLTVLVAA